MSLQGRLEAVSSVRSANEHVFNKQTMPTTMDTRRLLELCEATGAEPGNVSQARLDLLGCTDVFDASDAENLLRQTGQPLTAGPSIDLALPPHSVGLLTLALAPQ